MLNAGGDATSPDNQGRDRLIEACIPLVRRMAKRLASRLPANVDVDDLIGAGTEGLVRAADLFDATRHPQFEPYAKARIRGAMLDALRSMDPMTRYGRQRLSAVGVAVRKLEQQLGRAPEQDEVARQLGVSLGEYQQLVEELGRGPVMAGVIDADLETLSVGEDDPQRTLMQRDLKKRLARLVGKLPQNMQMTLALYYQEELTQAEIGRVLGLSDSRVCQLLAEATVRLRAAMEARSSRRPPAPGGQSHSGYTDRGRRSDSMSLEPIVAKED